LQSTARIAPIVPRYLRDQALGPLRDAIVTGALAPGEPIVIDALATAFGLSSMPVREAVKRLVADGLIEELPPRRAHRVAPLTRRSALDVIEVTETLIVRAYEVGVPRLDDAGIAEMRRALDSATVHARSGDLLAALAAIHELHGVVYAATGNAEYARTLRALVPRFNRILYLWYGESIREVGTSYRRDVVEALEHGDRKAAVKVVRTAWRRFHDVVAAREDEA